MPALTQAQIGTDGLAVAEGQEELLPSDPEMNMNGYKTLAAARRTTKYIVNKSRFIGQRRPGGNAGAGARPFWHKIRQQYKDATHNCYAYIIGKNAGIMRYSDDGEPGGTAGMPIIEVMKARGVVDCAVVVTRYFGGILLGAGGLVRAYSHTCALALNAAKVCEMHPTVRYMAEVAYPLWDRVQHQLKSLPVRLENPEFTAAVAFELVMKETDEAKVREELTRVTDGRMEWLKTEETYSPWEEENSDGLV